MPILDKPEYPKIPDAHTLTAYASRGDLHEPQLVRQAADVPIMVGESV
jgi:hypothetical protein